MKSEQVHNFYTIQQIQKTRKMYHILISGEPDLAIFDFTNLYAARNSCRAVVRKGFPLLMGIVGDRWDLDKGWTSFTFLEYLPLRTC